MKLEFLCKYLNQTASPRKESETQLTGSVVWEKHLNGFNYFKWFEIQKVKKNGNENMSVAKKDVKILN